MDSNATGVAASAAAAGVAASKWLRGCATERQCRTAVLALLTVIGIRLVIGGLGVAR